MNSIASLGLFVHLLKEGDRGSEMVAEQVSSRDHAEITAKLWNKQPE